MPPRGVIHRIAGWASATSYDSTSPHEPGTCVLAAPTRVAGESDCAAQLSINRHSTHDAATRAVLPNDAPLIMLYGLNGSLSAALPKTGRSPVIKAARGTTEPSTARVRIRRSAFRSSHHRHGLRANVVPAAQTCSANARNPPMRNRRGLNHQGAVALRIRQSLPRVRRCRYRRFVPWVGTCYAAMVGRRRMHADQDFVAFGRGHCHLRRFQDVGSPVPVDDDCLHEWVASRQRCSMRGLPESLRGSTAPQRNPRALR